MHGLNAGVSNTTKHTKAIIDSMEQLASTELGNTQKNLKLYKCKNKTYLLQNVKTSTRYDYIINVTSIKSKISSVPIHTKKNVCNI